MILHVDMSRCAASCALVLLLGASVGPGSGASGVAYIYSYSGYSDAYRVTRDGKTLAVAPLLWLAPGDRIAIVSPRDRFGNPSVITVSVNGELTRIDAAHSPFCIGAASGICGSSPVVPSLKSVQNETLAGLRRVLTSVAPVMREAHDSAYSSQVDQMTTQGSVVPPAPVIPMLPSAPLAVEPVSAAVVAFGWLGGQAPFTVTIFSLSSSRPLVTQPSVSRNSVTISGVQLTSGRYAVRVEDALGRTAQGAFQCINGDLPPLPIDQIGGGITLPVSTIAIIRAGLLARQGRQYYLAAYEALASLPDDGPGGDVYGMRTWLAKGLPFQAN